MSDWGFVKPEGKKELWIKVRDVFYENEEDSKVIALSEEEAISFAKDILKECSFDELSEKGETK